MRTLPNIWIASIPTYDEVLDQIEVCIDVLKENALEANFFDPAVKKKYCDDVQYMKQFFERAENLARGRQ